METVPPLRACGAPTVATALCACAQAMLLNAYEWSFKACTSTGSGPQLSAREKRCITGGVAKFIDARSHIAQAMMAAAGTSGGGGGGGLE